MNIFTTLPWTSAIYLHRPLLVLGPQILKHNLKTYITITFTFLIYFISFGFDHDIALSITRIFKCTMQLWIYNQWVLHSNNLSPLDQLIWGDKLFRVTCTSQSEFCRTLGFCDRKTTAQWENCIQYNTVFVYFKRLHWYSCKITEREF